MDGGRRVGVAIVGAGIAGIATAYYLGARRRGPSLVLVDPLPPMSFTSAQSGDNYRNWWPHPTMTAFTNHGIDLLEAIAAEAPGAAGLRRRGYLLATRRADIGDLLADLEAGYGESAADAIRIHERAAGSYRAAGAADAQSAPRGVDVLSSPALVAATWPVLGPGIRHLLHIRRGGELDSAGLAAWMLDRVRAAGGRLLRGRCRAIAGASPFTLDVETADGTGTVVADAVVNAAGPFAAGVAGMLGAELPVQNVFQQKVAFEDTRGAVPRDLPFMVDLDPVTLDWPADVREELAVDPALARLAAELPGGRHCRPDGAAGGSRIKLGWAFNRSASEPVRDLASAPELDPVFPELVLRGLATLLPGFAAYVDEPPRRFAHYGGYYTMTRENWPLIGPLGPDGAFVVAALSGFGTMAACAAGRCAAGWITGAELPPYAADLSPARYADTERIGALTALAGKSLL